MKEQLQDKLLKAIPYTDQELAWCLSNIGHPDPNIRDNLIYNTFGYGFEHQLISPDQFLWLTHQIQNEQLLNHQDTLTRSFSVLLASLIISCDNWEGSPYFSLLENSRADFFNVALLFIENETDKRGFDKDLGWIHAVAHGSEVLMATALHDKFPKEDIKKIWQAITTLLYKQTSVFTAGESDRLAFIFIQLVLSEKLEQKELAQWFNHISITEESPEEYFCSLNIKSFLSAIYLTLEKEEILTPELKQAILNHF